MVFFKLEISKVLVFFVKGYVFSLFISDAHHLAICIPNKVFQLVQFITLSSFSIGNIEKYVPAFFFSKLTCFKSVMANSGLTVAIQAFKDCLGDRKSRGVLGFRSCFLNGLKYRHSTLLLVSIYIHTNPVKTTLSTKKSCYYFEKRQIFSEDI